MILFSTPLVSTWTFVESARLLVDCGDGVCAHMGGKIHKVDWVALTHAHRDHIGGLMQFLNLRGGNGSLKVLYPKGSGSFPALAKFLSKFDPDSSGRVEWISVDESSTFDLGSGLSLKTFATDHVSHLGPNRSLGYKLERTTKKLRPEFLGEGANVPILVRERGEAAVFASELSNEAAFCGDGLPLDYGEVAESKVLVTECTFLDEQVATREHRHLFLEELHRFVLLAKPSKLILNHISARYSNSEIFARVSELAWPCEVSIVYPGELTTIV